MPENLKETGLVFLSRRIGRVNRAEPSDGPRQSPLIHHNNIMDIFRTIPQEFGGRGDECREGLPTVPQMVAIRLLCPTGS